MADPHRDFIRGQKLFAGFSDSELDVLMGIFRRQTLEDGKPVFREGRPGNACFIVVEGRIKVTIGHGDKMQELAKLPPGTIFGQVALIDGGRRSAGCWADGPTTVLGLDRNEFDLMFRSGSTFAFKFLDVLTRILVGQLRNANTRLVEVASKEKEAAQPRDAADPEMQDFFKQVATQTNSFRVDDFDLDDVEVVHSVADQQRQHPQ